MYIQWCHQVTKMHTLHPLMYLPLHQSPLSQYDYKITIIRPSKKSCTAVTQQTLFRGGPLDILGGGGGGGGSDKKKFIQGVGLPTGKKILQAVGERKKKFMQLHEKSK